MHLKPREGRQESPPIWEFLKRHGVPHDSDDFEKPEA
jgi:hypothetical protein